MKSLQHRPIRVLLPECLAPKVRGTREDLRERGIRLGRRKPVSERREWPRLPLAIPVFVRGRDHAGKDFLEFATALNISAGGALVAVHRALRPAAQVSLEIPSAPLAESAPAQKNSRNLRGKIVRVNHAEGYSLIGLKFRRPVTSPEPSTGTPRRKVASSV
jgi:PilZ domain